MSDSKNQNEAMTFDLGNPNSKVGKRPNLQRRNVPKNKDE